MSKLYFDDTKIEVHEITMCTVNDDFIIFHCDEMALKDGLYYFYINDNVIAMMPEKLILADSIRYDKYIKE